MTAPTGPGTISDSGCIHRHARLTWGQQYIWLSHHQLPSWAQTELTFTVRYVPPPGSTVATLRLALDTLARRHETLRTRIHLDGAGAPLQCASLPGPVPVRCHETASAGRPLSEVLADFVAEPFALGEQWPVRACIVTQAGRPTLMLVVWHHFAIDDWGRHPLADEFNELHDAILAGGAARLAPVRKQPVDLAGFEESQQGQRLSRQALEYWEHRLYTMPADQFVRRLVPEEGEAASYSASLSSPAALAAVRTLADRHRVWPSIVCTAAFAMLLAAYTGHASTTFFSHARNRDGLSFPDVLTCLFQPALTSVNCEADPSFDELLRRTAEGCGQALANAYYRYEDAMTMLERASSERGAPLRVGTSFSYLRHTFHARGGSRTLFNWNRTPETWSLLDDDLLLRVFEWQDCLAIALSAQATAMRRQDVEVFLRAFEQVLVAAAEDSTIRFSAFADTVGVRAPAPWLPDTVVVDRTPVSPARIAACVAECPEVRAAHVFLPHNRPNPESVVAYVATGDVRLRAHHLRTHLLNRMYDLDQLRCPDRFIVCDGAPDRPDDPHSWSACRVIEEGNGRGAPVRRPDGTRERALADAIGAVTGVTAANLADSYIGSGGSVLAAPQVVKLLREAGWTGLTVRHLLQARPLTALSQRLMLRTSNGPHDDA